MNKLARVLQQAVRQVSGGERDVPRRHLRPSLHGHQPRALPLSEARSREAQRRVPRHLVRGPRHQGSRRQLRHRPPARGVNVCGYDEYKRWITEVGRRPRISAPCSALFTPSSARTSRMIKAVSKLDEVSFHMSGTEAIIPGSARPRRSTRVASSSCASPAPTTAGGTAFSPDPVTSARSRTCSP